MTLTSHELKEILHYDPETGVFTWLESRGKAAAGSRAGKVTMRGYRCIGYKGKSYNEAHLAWLYMKGEFPTLNIDHINRVKTDNRWKNLRQATKTANNLNRGMNPNNVSGVTGVRPRGDRWFASISFKGKSLWLGIYDKKEDAIAARLAAEEKYHKPLMQKETFQ